MKRILVLILVFILVIFCTSAVWAGVPAGFGAKAVGMGGAFTAVADDGSAPYWNPAGITQNRFITFTPAIGLQGKYDVSDELIKTNGGLPEFSENDFQLASMSYVGITSKYFAVNGMFDVNAMVTSESDTMTASAESYGYGVLTIAGTFGEKIAVGVNLKTVQSVVVASTVNRNLSGQKVYAEGEGMAFDIGVLYRLSDKTRIGFIGRNVYGKIDWNDGTIQQYAIGGDASGEEQPLDTADLDSNIPKTYAVGIAFNPYQSLTIAADAEMINAPGKDNDQTRFHVGLEQTALWKSVALRLGAYTNKDEDITITGGLGFKLLVLLVDLAYVEAENAAGYYVTAGLKF